MLILDTELDTETCIFKVNDEISVEVIPPISILPRALVAPAVTFSTIDVNFVES